MCLIGIHSCVVSIIPPNPFVSWISASICSMASSGVPMIHRRFCTICSNVRSSGFWSGCVSHPCGVFMV